MTDPGVPSPLAAGQIEIWKKIVDVQQHFNDLELRIRNFALVVTGAFLGLGGYAIKDAGIINAFGLEVSIAGSVVLSSAIFPLFAFYFMDRLWYHRLLDGAVTVGIEAEVRPKRTISAIRSTLGSKILRTQPVHPVVDGEADPLKDQNGHVLSSAGSNLADRRVLPRLRRSTEVHPGNRADSICWGNTCRGHR